jgi:hypothetical protein
LAGSTVAENTTVRRNIDGQPGELRAWEEGFLSFWFKNF